MAEWSMAHAWKVCIRQKRIMGSNPILSAINCCFFRYLYLQDERSFKTILKMALNNNLFSRIMTIFGFFMVPVYLGIGVILIYFPAYTYLPPTLPQNLKSVLGLFFIAYGIFRFARIYQKNRELKRKEFYNEKD